MNNYIDKKLIEKFWSKVHKTKYCWIWTGGKDKQQYGLTYRKNKTIKAHRLSFEIHNNYIDKDLCVCHHCDNPSCVNPSHLFLGTKKDNTQDMMKKGRGEYLKRRIKVIDIQQNKIIFTGLMAEFANKINVKYGTLSYYKSKKQPYHNLYLIENQ